MRKQRHPITCYNGALYQPRFVPSPQSGNANHAFTHWEAYFSLTAVTLHLPDIPLPDVPAHKKKNGKDTNARQAIHPRSMLEHKVIAIARALNRTVMYDNHPSARVIRCPDRTLLERRGMCTEKGLLFFASLRSIGIEAEFTFGANPIDYFIDGAYDFGVHPFFRIGNKYASAETGIYGSFAGVCTSRTPALSPEEIIGVIAGQTAEHYALKRRDNGRARQLCAAGLCADPNNYTLLTQLAELSAREHDRLDAEEFMSIAKEIAPSCGDIDKLWGDILSYYFDDRTGALDAYGTALEKGLTDAQLAAQVAVEARGTSLEEQAIEQFAILSRQASLHRYAKERTTKWGKSSKLSPLYEAAGWNSHKNTTA